ncbi:restriction endonuclease [Cellulophaga lytica DSM 7489]|uniref:Restriction endonuclease n=1 Tax=Cellulophaga lytica (strain ATCC 23178 / DSM 7489 / JCM 8516 / NBRC 14961 / NCIMB 1423 / VKM B-1433 / Cy l20) TaxID=867900 RepID=F0RC61_CELLC|nr:restriction endonuclease [Cellulophaga lytica]ADY30725.1 restriction endonuclease [Cellulophaga lytica DSM 7489]WQG78351.1 restriction endonuclease [Cellulophaga lytica]
MELPKYHETFIPILETLNSIESTSSRELARKVRDNYYSELPKELLDKKTSSGANVLIDRILWGKSYLKMGKFVSYPRRGMVKITDKGKQTLTNGQLLLSDLKNDPDFVQHRTSVKSKKDDKTELETVDVDSSSPQDLIDTGFETIETEVKTELLDKLKELDPYFFEKVILILLKKMGYGDFIETSKSGDGGIDGIINEDKLGLEKIYTQAKRYNENKVREKDIRNFIGAMSGDTSKGVFITTSTFDASAIKKAREAHHSIILVDGPKLVDLMHQYNVGIQVKTTYEVKEIDYDFFEGE